MPVPFGLCLCAVGLQDGDGVYTPVRARTRAAFRMCGWTAALGNLALCFGVCANQSPGFHCSCAPTPTPPWSAHPCSSLAGPNPRPPKNSDIPVHVYGPPGTADVLATMMRISQTYLHGTIVVNEVGGGGAAGRGRLLEGAGAAAARAAGLRGLCMADDTYLCV